MDIESVREETKKYLPAGTDVSYITEDHLENLKAAATPEGAGGPWKASQLVIRNGTWYWNAECSSTIYQWRGNIHARNIGHCPNGWYLLEISFT